MAAAYHDEAALRRPSYTESSRAGNISKGQSAIGFRMSAHIPHSPPTRDLAPTRPRPVGYHVRSATGGPPMPNPAARIPVKLHRQVSLIRTADPVLTEELLAARRWPSSSSAGSPTPCCSSTPRRRTPSSTSSGGWARRRAWSGSHASRRRMSTQDSARLPGPEGRARPSIGGSADEAPGARPMYKIVGTLVAVSLSMAGRIAMMQYVKPPAMPQMPIAIPGARLCPAGRPCRSCSRWPCRSRCRDSPGFPSPLRARSSARGRPLPRHGRRRGARARDRASRRRTARRNRSAGPPGLRRPPPPGRRNPAAARTRRRAADRPGPFLSSGRLSGSETLLTCGGG